MKFEHHSAMLLIASSALILLFILVGASMPSKKEKDAYAGGFIIGVLFMIFFSAWALSK